MAWGHRFPKSAAAKRLEDELLREAADLLLDAVRAWDAKRSTGNENAVIVAAARYERARHPLHPVRVVP